MDSVRLVDRLRGIPSKMLVQRAAEYGVLVEAGDVHFKDAMPARAYIRLAFSAIDVARIEQGLQRLREVIASFDHNESESRCHAAADVEGYVD